MTQLHLDAAAGNALKQAGLDAVEGADTVFVTFMRIKAREISDTKGMVSSDDLRVLAYEHNMMPQSPNVWGAIFRGPKWKIIGRRKSAVEGNHGREIRVWRYEV